MNRGKREDNLVLLPAWHENGSVYRFAMDLGIIQEHGTVSKNFYEQELERYKEEAIYSFPQEMLTLCHEHYNNLVFSYAENYGENSLNIKKLGLRPLNTALYAARAIFKIKTPFLQDILNNFVALNFITREEQARITDSFKVILDLRHKAGLILQEAADYNTFTLKEIQRIAQEDKTVEKDYYKKAEISCHKLRIIAGDLLERLDRGKNEILYHSAPRG